VTVRFQTLFFAHFTLHYPRRTNGPDLAERGRNEDAR